MLIRKALGVIALAVTLWWWTASPAVADPPTTTAQQPTQDQQCQDPTYAKLHPTICHPDESPFGMGGGGGGNGGGLISHILRRLGL